jgi:hypothetical protein
LFFIISIKNVFIYGSCIWIREVFKEGNTYGHFKKIERMPSYIRIWFKKREGVVYGVRGIRSVIPRYMGHFTEGKKAFLYICSSGITTYHMDLAFTFAS